MRKNEYNSLDEFVDEYSTGKSFSWQNAERKEKFMGIEFKYNNVCYRMCREPGKDEDMPVLPDGKRGRYDVMICHLWMPEYEDDDFQLVGWYADLDDVLENCIIDGRKFKDVIMDDDTVITGKD